MLVEGRTWKYTVENVDFDGGGFPPAITWESRYLKFSGDTVIDGETFVKFYEFNSGSTTPIQGTPYFYAREDINTGVVYAFMNPQFSVAYGMPYLNEDVRVLYDFENPNNNFQAFSCAPEFYVYWEYEGANGIESTSIDLKNGINVTTFDYQYFGGIAQCIGWYSTESCNLSGNLLGPPIADFVTCFMQSRSYCYLYAVCEADGTEIFAIEEHRPEVMGLEAVRAEGADSEAVAVYYRFDGVRFDRRPTEPGIYLRVSGGDVSKVII